MSVPLPARRSSAEPTPVLVVGGGPVGLSLAFELGWRGVDCVVVEPRTTVSSARPRAKTTSVRTMEHLRRWGIADEVRRRAPLPVSYSDEAVFCTTLLGREITRIDGCFGLTAERDDRYSEAGQQLPQPLYEQVLRDELARFDSVELATGWRVAELEDRGTHVVAELVGEDGAARRIEARFAVGCDGARSVTREAIGSRYVGGTDLRPNFNLVFRSVGLGARHRLGPAVHYWVLNPEVSGVLGPLDLEDTWWVIATGVAEEVGRADPQRIVRSLVGAAVDAEVLSTDPWTARMAVAEPYAAGRIFLAGDAAHLNPPWGGHGFNTGVGDAVNLGWKLAAVLDGWGGARLLESYAAERRPVAVDTVALAESNMRVLAADLADPLLSEDGSSGDARRHAAASYIHLTKEIEFRSLGLVLGYAYDRSPVVVDDASAPGDGDPEHYVPSARPGSRLPHQWLESGRSLFDELGPGFTLLLTDRGAGGTSVVRAAAERSLPLEVVRLPGGGAVDYGGPALLVRPDQHVGWRGDPSTADVGAVLDVLRGAGDRRPS